MRCSECEYETVCFRPLRLLNKVYDSCKQGRAKRKYKVKPVTLKQKIDSSPTYEYTVNGVKYFGGAATQMAEKNDNLKVPVREKDAPSNSSSHLP